MAEKNSFILRNEYLDIFADLSDSQAGVLIKAVYKYAAAKEMPEGLKDVEVKMAFKFIKKDIDYDTTKYNELCESRRNAVAKRWETNKSIQKHTKNTNVYKCIQEHTKNTNVDFVIHSDSDSDSDSELVDKSTNKEKESKEKEISNSLTKRFVKPSIDEIKAYCFERKNNVDPQRFYDFYESKGWKVGSSPMKDWKAAVRTWEQRNTLIGAEKKQSERELWRLPSPAGKYDV